MYQNPRSVFRFHCRKYSYVCRVVTSDLSWSREAEGALNSGLAECSGHTALYLIRNQDKMLIAVQCRPQMTLLDGFAYHFRELNP